MNFSEALNEVKKGNKVKREGWSKFNYLKIKDTATHLSQKPIDAVDIPFVIKVVNGYSYNYYADIDDIDGKWVLLN